MFLSPYTAQRTLGCARAFPHMATLEQVALLHIDVHTQKQI